MYLENTNTTRETVIERLRESKNENNAVGLKDGRTWAQVSAEYDELISLEEEFARIDEIPYDVSIDWIISLIDPKLERDLKWDYLIGEKNWQDFGKDPGYIEGFLFGAFEVWEDVKDDI